MTARMDSLSSLLAYAERVMKTEESQGLDLAVQTYSNVFGTPQKWFLKIISSAES